MSSDVPPDPAARRPTRRFDWDVLRSPSPSSNSPPPSPVAADRAEPGVPRAPDTALPASDATADTSLALRVNDLKQFAYCPRIVFFQYAMPVQRRATYKMEHGKQIEAAIEGLEKRRTLREYDLDEGTRRFQVSLWSVRLGLSGRIDLLIETPTAACPVDFKDTTQPIHHNHHVQLCAYALLVEEATGKPVRAGFVYRVPRDDITAVEITDSLRAETRRALQHIRAMIVAEHMPPPTAVRQRCEDCEYRNYCGDIF